MFKKGYKQTEEHKRKIGLANSIALKRYYRNGGKSPIGMTGKKLTDEQKKKISIAGKGRKHSIATIQKLKENTKTRHQTFRKGCIPWNKGLYGYKSKPASEERKRKISEAQKGEKSYMYGKKLSEITREKIGQAAKLLWEKNWYRDRMSGENSPSWRGGKSFEPYGVEFNNKLKEQIRERDNYKCQECNFPQEKLKRKLHIHHIDYNKQNNNESNLIALCNSCHIQTNFSRADWISYFKNKIHG